MGVASGLGMSTQTQYPKHEPKLVSDFQRACEDELLRLQNERPSIRRIIMRLAKEHRFLPRELLLCAEALTEMKSAVVVDPRAEDRMVIGIALKMRDEAQS